MRLSRLRIVTSQLDTGLTVHHLEDDVAHEQAGLKRQCTSFVELYAVVRPWSHGLSAVVHVCGPITNGAETLHTDHPDTQLPQQTQKIRRFSLSRVPQRHCPSLHPASGRAQWPCVLLMTSHLGKVVDSAMIKLRPG